MADYAIGDVQGCYEPLMRLLDEAGFAEGTDRLWFTGDLANRGPQSLEVLRFVRALGDSAIVTLGNHDLHLLARIFVPETRAHYEDTLDDVLASEECMVLGHWLREQPLLYHDPSLGVVMTHAGILPGWDLSLAKICASELESVLRGANFCAFLEQMYGNQPDRWDSTLTGIDRLRFITNVFTRMRFCHADGRLDLRYKGTVEHAPQGLVPWFRHPRCKTLEAEVVFGHWAALNGLCEVPGVYALDTGCVWGNRLTALRLQDGVRLWAPCG